jgi:nucleoid-associated protein YgaU
MLRITRLHMLLAAIGVAFLSVGAYNWFKIHPLQLRKAPTAAVVPQTPTAELANSSPASPLDAAKTVAQVGEAYDLLRRQFGNIPPVSEPLRAAKQALAAGDSTKALTAARESWQALKIYKGKVADYSADTYQVTRGDTLWRIAAAHSPAKAGAGWVTIWKANQTVVKDFNRIEVGWTLIIPPKPTQYVMPFWKPLGIN